MAACTEIENELGLAHTKTLDEFRSETGHRRNIVQAGDIGEFRRTGKVKNKVQLAIQERKRKENERNREAHQPTKRDDDRLAKVKTTNRQKNAGDGKTHQSPGNGFGIDQKRTVKKNKQTVLVTPPTIGARDSRLHPGTIDLFFFSDHADTPVMRWSEADQRLDVLRDDPETILAALQIAQKSGIEPLQVFGSLEFQIAACKIAIENGITVKSTLPQAHHQAADTIKAEAVTARDTAAREAIYQQAAKDEEQRKKAVEMCAAEEDRKPGHQRLSM